MYRGTRSYGIYYRSKFRRVYLASFFVNSIRIGFLQTGDCCFDKTELSSSVMSFSLSIKSSLCLIKSQSFGLRCVLTRVHDPLSVNDNLPFFTPFFIWGMDQTMRAGEQADMTGHGQHVACSTNTSLLTNLGLIRSVLFCPALRYFCLPLDRLPDYFPKLSKLRRR
jgi:hypothetical protein